jgi:hypothetical protein
MCVFLRRKIAVGCKNEAKPGEVISGFAADQVLTKVRYPLSVIDRSFTQRNICVYYTIDSGFCVTSLSEGQQAAYAGVRFKSVSAV